MSDKKYDLTKITDFETLEKLRAQYQGSFAKPEDENKFLLYVAPKNKIEQKVFEAELMRQRVPIEKLKDGSFIKEVFPNDIHLSVECELYVFRGIENYRSMLFRHSLISLLNSSEPHLIFLGI